MTRRSGVCWGGRSGVLGLMLGCLVRATPVGAASPPAVSPGSYTYEGGWGTLTVKGTPGKAQTFKLETLGGNAHSCTLEGDVKGLEGRTKGEDEPCTIKLEPAGAQVTVTPVTEDACRGYCGARARFTGTYFLPAPECRPAAVTATRAKFKKRYDAKDYEGARALLAGLLTSCTPVINAFDVMWIRNDLALTQHHTGDDAGCRETLQPLEDLANEDPENVGGGEPAYADTLKRIARATRTNLKLCASTKTGN